MRLFLLCLILSQSLIAQPMIIGGIPVKEGEYSEVIRIRSGNAYCTASIIGPEVILTAAHCTKNNGEIVPVSQDDYEFVYKQNVYTAKCTTAPEYKHEQGDQDIALCKTNRPIRTRFASISTKLVSLNDNVILIGYGCTNKNASGGNDGILRYGLAKVTRISTDDYFSFHAKGKTTLCYGDSGGPSFKYMLDPRNQHHYIIGVGSRGNLIDLSLLTEVAHKKNLQWMQEYEQANDVQICGLSLECDKTSNRNCKQDLLTLKQSVRLLDQCLSN